MPGIGGYDVWVEVDGKRLEEFDFDEDFECDGVPLLTSHIASEAGKQFRIGCTLPKREVKRENLCITLRIDGRNIFGENAYFDKDPSAKADVTQYYELDVLGNGNARTFVFGSLEYTDDDALLGMEHNALGTIQLNITSYAELKYEKRAKKVKPSDNPGFRAPATQDYVHERSKKGLTHCVKFGEEKRHKEPKGPSWWVDMIDEESLFDFQFIYRSMDTLMAKGIAPRPDSEPPTTNPSSPQADVPDTAIAQDAPPNLASSNASQSQPAVAHSPEVPTWAMRPTPSWRPVTVTGQPSTPGNAAQRPSSFAGFFERSLFGTFPYCSPVTRNLVPVVSQAVPSSSGTLPTEPSQRAPSSNGSESPVHRETPVDEYGGLEYLTPTPEPTQFGGAPSPTRGREEEAVPGETTVQSQLPAPSPDPPALPSDPSTRSPVPMVPSPEPPVPPSNSSVPSPDPPPPPSNPSPRSPSPTVSSPDPPAPPPSDPSSHVSGSTVHSATPPAAAAMEMPDNEEKTISVKIEEMQDFLGQHDEDLDDSDDFEMETLAARTEALRQEAAVLQELRLAEAKMAEIRARKALRKADKRQRDASAQRVVKKEGVSERSLKRVKREHTSTLVPGEVIDLTL